MDYRKKIHTLFEQLRSEIEIRNKIQILQLEILERMEQRALEENSKAALDHVKIFMKRRNKRYSIFPLLERKLKL